MQTGFGLLDTPLMCGNTPGDRRAQNQHLTPPDDGPRKRPKPPGSQPGKVAGTIPQRGAQSMDKVKFFNQQLNGQIVMSELEAEHLADSIRLLSAGEDPTTWAEEVAVHAATLAR